MQAKASQKQAEGQAKGNGALLCVCFEMLVGKVRCHMLRFALYGLVCFVWLGFALFMGTELSHVTVCFALFVGEVCHTLRFALFCSCEASLSHVTICLHCFASLRFALLCFALHCSCVE